MSLKVMELDSNLTSSFYETQPTLSHQDAITGRPTATYSLWTHMCCTSGGVRRNARSGMTAARFSRCADTRQWSLLHTSLNPLWLALCWNSHRLSKQSNSGSIHPSIGGIETELVVSRGQEILTGALCRLLAGGCMHAHIYTDCTAEDLVWWEPQILVKARIQIYEQDTFSSSSMHICLPTHSNRSYRPPRDTNYLHTNTSAFISYKQIQVLSAQVRAVCQQFVSKWGHPVSFSSWISSWLPPRLLALNWHSR